MGTNYLRSIDQLVAALTVQRNRKINDLTARDERRMAELKEEASHLGIFKGKRKKEIAKELEELAARIEKYRG